MWALLVEVVVEVVDVEVGSRSCWWLWSGSCGGCCSGRSGCRCCFAASA